MNKAIESRLFGVWLGLSAVTFLSWWLGAEYDGANAEPNAAVTYSALVIAAIKVRVIVVEFMEARRSSKKLQTAMDAWLFGLVAALAAIYHFKLEMPAV